MPASAFPRATAGGAAGWRCPSTPGRDGPVSYTHLCGRTEADGVPFERIRRITGYLVGTLDRFNNAKRAEEHDRVKHSV